MNIACKSEFVNQMTMNIRIIYFKWERRYTQWL